VLVLAGCVAMSDEQIEQVRRYAAGGGRVVLLGPVATHDEWLTPRKTPALQDLPDTRSARVENVSDLAPTLGTLLQTPPSLMVNGPQGLYAELTEQAGRRLVHLVNYKTDAPARSVEVRVQLPAGKRAKGATLARPGYEKDRDLEIREEENAIKCVVPAIEIYGILVVSWDAPG